MGDVRGTSGRSDLTIQGCRLFEARVRSGWHVLYPIVLYCCARSVELGSGCGCEDPSSISASSSGTARGGTTPCGFDVTMSDQRLAVVRLVAPHGMACVLWHEGRVEAEVEHREPRDGTGTRGCRVAVKRYRARGWQRTSTQTRTNRHRHDGPLEFLSSEE